MKEVSRKLKISNQPIQIIKNVKYQGFQMQSSGFTKEVNEETKLKCRRTCSEILGQPLMSISINIKTINTVYKINVRGILSYGCKYLKQLL